MTRTRLLSVAEVADRLNVSRQTAWRRVQTSLIHFRDGQIIRVPEDALDRFIAQNMEYPTCLRDSGKRRASTAKKGSTGTQGSGSLTGNQSHEPPDAPTSQRPALGVVVRNNASWPKVTQPRTKPQPTPSDKP